MAKQENLYAIIMAGGSGTRFWPLSTPAKPKQFHQLGESDQSLLQLTVQRISRLIALRRILIVTNQQHADLVREQLPGLPPDNIIFEPVGRNTAPCIALASMLLQSRINQPDAVTVVLPADHWINDEDKFVSLLEQASIAAQTPERIITLGITPTRPETGYGYVELEDQQGDHHSESSSATDLTGSTLIPVRRFVEKPDSRTAQAYLAAGNFLWNSGIFIWSLRTVLTQLQHHQPQLYSLLEPILSMSSEEEKQQFIQETFPLTKAISIDYALLEKTKDLVCLQADVGWNDVGNWQAMLDLFGNPEGNLIDAIDHFSKDSQSCLVLSRSHKVAVLGVKNLIVVEKDGYLLISSLDAAQNIRQAAAYYADE